MAQTCTICASDKRAELDAGAQAGKSGRAMATELGLSLAAVYRHLRSRHHIAPQTSKDASGSTNGAAHDLGLAPAISATLRDVQRLAREAQRHLRDARKAGDHRATNGAITAAAKALELVGKLRGELQSGANVSVQLTSEARIAMDLHAQVNELASHDIMSAACSYLAAQLEAGDAHAVRCVLELMRMVPSAEVPQALTGAKSSEPEA